VVPEAFAQSFAIVAAGSVADGADVGLVITPVRCRCLTCGEAFETRDPLPACPACGSLRMERAGGDELILESIEYLHTVERT
jgi:hydrogenase nickel incorporation protein HypA/HybF